MKRIAYAARGIATLMCCTLGLWSGASAQGTFPDPNANCPPSQCGQVSPFIPMQSTEAVHMGLVWKKDSQKPKILFHARFPEYTPNDMADPTLVDLAIARGALTTAGNQFSSSLRDVLHGFDPFLGLGPDREADDSFQRLTYGGCLMRQELEAGLTGNAKACLARIRAAGREAIAQGADVILLACGLMNLVAIRNGLTEIDSVPVLDISGTLMKLTEAMVVLRRTSGIRIGRTGYFERPDRAEIDRVLGVYGVRNTGGGS